MFICELMTSLFSDKSINGRKVDKWTEEKKDNKSAEKSLESSLSVGSFLVLLDTYFMTSYCCTNMDGKNN